MWRHRAASFRIAPMECPHCHFQTASPAVSCAKCQTPLQGDPATLAGTPTPSEAASGSPGTPPNAPGDQTSGVATGWSEPDARSATRGLSGSLTALHPGTVLANRYEILRLLGEGGMGAVFQAHDRELDRLVALKVIRPELASRQEALRRFKQELILARQVTHKNVIRIFDLGESEGIKFITMEYVEGKDLKTLLYQKGTPTLAQAVSIIRQVSQALAAAHEEGVVHRDLKPQNIMVDGEGRVRVMDFGIARSVALGGMTETGALMGTPEYMSPEQVRGEEADARSDLFALGIIFYELLTGKIPYQADTPMASMFKRTQQTAIPPAEVNPGVPLVLSDIVSECLQVDRQRRYQSAREILHDLAAFEGGTPIGATPLRARARTEAAPVIAPRRAWRLWLVGAGLSGLILAVAIPSVRNVILRRPVESSATPAGIPPLTQGKYVGVLPFRVLGDPAPLKYISEGVVEALSARLFQLQSVHVASSSTARRIDPDESLEKIGRKLGVNLVIRGVVQGAGDHMRIIVNLEDVIRGQRLWSQEFSGVPKDLLTIEDQIYNQLVNAMSLQPTNEESARSGRPTEDIEAYDLYLKGRDALRDQQNIKKVRAAIDMFEAAVRKDPGFAVGYAGLADASLVMYRETRDSFWSQKALAAAQRAARLNDKLAEVHFSLGSVYNSTGKTAESIAELRRALELAPNSDEGYRRLAAAYLDSGRYEAAVQAYRKAIEVNPYYWLNQNAIGNAYLRMGDNQKAMDAFRRVTELEPENYFGYLNIGAVYFRSGKYEESIAPFQKSLQIQPEWATYSNLGTAYFYLKRYNESAKMFEKAVEMNPNHEVVVGNLADAYRWSGQSEKARTAYDTAISLAYKELQVNPRSASTMGSLALYYAKKGDTKQAAQFIRRARAIDRANASLMYIEAVVDALANRPAQALQALSDAFQRGYAPKEAESDPELDALRNLPGYQKLMKEFGQKSS